jgi:hypothetical protein
MDTAKFNIPQCEFLRPRRGPGRPGPLRTQHSAFSIQHSIVQAAVPAAAKPNSQSPHCPLTTHREKGTGPICRNGPKGAAHKLDLSPFPPADHDVIVGGPLCESGDIFTQEEGGYVCKRRLPAANIGDILVIECTGAYGFVMGSNYNSKPFAAEVLIDDKPPRLIRRRQTFDEMIAPERP